MRTNTKQQKHAAIESCDEQLAPIAVEILSIRSAFLDHLDTLPAPFGESIKRHYLERIVRAGDRHMLGEYGPFLLADVLRVPQKAATSIVIPWLVLYEHTLLVDDIVDVKGSSWAQDVLLSQILFDDFVSLWQERFFECPNLWQAFRTYHTEGVSAALKEMEQSLDATPEPRHDVNGDCDEHLIMGRKAALVKFCAAALSIEFRGRLLNPIEEGGIDKICAGIQLLDDLSDCAEDYKEGRDAFILRIAFDKIRGHHDFNFVVRNDLSEDELISFLILSGATTHVAKLACHYLTSGLAALDVMPDSATGRYLLSLVENTSCAAAAIEEMFTDNPHLIETMLLSFLKGDDSWKRLLAQSVYGDIWAEIKSRFNRIPNAAN